MDILVCIKRTPDTETRVSLAQGATALDPAGVKFVMNPYDEFAVEAGLRTRDSAGEGEVTVLSYGNEGSAEQLRAALAMGADRALLLQGDVAMDGLATAKAIAPEIQASGAELVLCGVKAVDDDQQQVGPMIATLLGWPCVTSVLDFEIDGRRVECRRGVEGGSERVEVELPAVVTVTKGAFEPRYASLKGIMAAKRKPLEEKAAEPAASRLTIIGLEPPPPRPEGRVVGEGEEAVTELVRLLREEAKAL